jgi:hypothetical protein
MGTQCLLYKVVFIFYRLIVVAEKDVVYQRFPIPLINRLEKHLLVMSTGLTKRQAGLVKDLEDWVKLFSEAKPVHLSGERYNYIIFEFEFVVIKYNYLMNKRFQMVI